MGNLCITKNKAASPYEAESSNRASSSTDTNTRGGQTINSVNDLPPAEKEAFLNVHDPVRAMNLNENTLLYRSTDKRFISRGHLKGNPNSIARIFNYDRLRPNPYLQLVTHRNAPPYFPVEMRASELKDPSLNVMVGLQAREAILQYAKRDNVSVEMRLGDFMRQGGKVYSDTSSAISSNYATALVVTLPKGSSVPVTII
ncbi:hypothetical protein BIY29_14850 [Brenneria alni]|uniref:Type III effector n=1 Tax=Brenneria alni TaxID=71656 RepID=A0A421DL53_9GAMM|nr:AvrPphF family type III effector [Brenneria alni]RLM20710.1 hypothetical protein BIY29_14850 [Brenneria alni]